MSKGFWAAQVGIILVAFGFLTFASTAAAFGGFLAGTLVNILQEKDLI